METRSIAIEEIQQEIRANSHKAQLSGSAIEVVKLVNINIGLEKAIQILKSK